VLIEGSAEIRRTVESNGKRYLCDRIRLLAQKLSGTIQPDGTDEFARRLSRQCLELSVQLNPAERYALGETFDVKLGIVDMLFDDC